MCSDSDRRMLMIEQSMNYTSSKLTDETWQVMQVPMAAGTNSHDFNLLIRAQSSLPLSLSICYEYTLLFVLCTYMHTYQH